MLKKIGIENFKSFKNFTVFELGKLNLVAGLNSSGKSSIYQAIFLLAQSFGYNISDNNGNVLPCLTLNGHLVKLGKNSEILHDTSKPFLKFMLAWEDKSEVSYTFSLSNKAGQSIKSSELGDFCLSKIKHTQADGTGYTAQKKEGKWFIEAMQFLSFGDYQLMSLIFDFLKKCAEKAGERSGSLCLNTNMRFLGGLSADY